MESSIIHSDGGSMYAGPEAVNVFRCYVIGSAMKLYAKTGIKANRMYTPTAMLNAVHEITGMRFKRTQMMEAAQFLILWADAKRYGIKETSTRVNDVAHAYAVLRWMLDDRESVVEDMKNLKITRAADVFEAIDNMAADCGLQDPLLPDWTLSHEDIEARRKAIANLKEIANGA